MIPRLTVCFGLSVLLHGMLLLSAAPAFRAGGRGYVPAAAVEPRKLDVFLESASGKAKPAADAVKQASSMKPETASPVPAKPLLIPPPAVTAPAQPATAPGWLVQPPPDIRNPQMDYRQIYEMQARQQAMQQARMFSDRIQADIEQNLNQHERPQPGKCVWEKTSSRLVCDSQALERRMHEESSRLAALRSSIQTQGNMLDGFVIGATGDRVTFTLQWQPADGPTSGTRPGTD